MRAEVSITRRSETNLASNAVDDGEHFAALDGSVSVRLRRFVWHLDDAALLSRNFRTRRKGRVPDCLAGTFFFGGVPEISFFARERGSPETRNPPRLLEAGLCVCRHKRRGKDRVLSPFRANTTSVFYPLIRHVPIVAHAKPTTKTLWTTVSYRRSGCQRVSLDNKI